MNPLFSNMLGHYAGMQVFVKDAQEQRRTPCDVRGPWVRPRCPSKLSGRKGTRRGWKRKNAPHYIYFYREPDDLIVIRGRMVIATPRQFDALKKAIPETVT